MSETPLLDELEKGKWPSFVSEIKKAAERSEKARGLLDQLELSYKEKKTHWKHGGIVGVRGYGGWLGWVWKVGSFDVGILYFGCVLPYPSNQSQDTKQ